MDFNMPGAVGFSGAQEPEGHQAKESVQQFAWGQEPRMAAKPPDSAFVQLSDHDWQKLRNLAADEEETMGKAKTAFERRERFCIEIEKKHGISGRKWTFDAKTGRLVIKEE